MNKLYLKLNKGIGDVLSRALTLSYIKISNNKVRILAVIMFLSFSTQAVAGIVLDEATSSSESFFNLTSLNDAHSEVIYETLEFTATAYSSTSDQTDDSPFITAANTRVRDGIVATNSLPLHTKIKIPALYGNKIFVVEDRMNKRYGERVTTLDPEKLKDGGRLDIWFPETSKALKFGIKKVTVQIL